MATDNSSIEAKFQCKVHELRNDTDWVNLKRSIIRAPQIIKNKFKRSGSISTDEAFDVLYKRFTSIDDSLHVLEKELLHSVRSVNSMMTHSVGITEAMAKLFDPNLESPASEADSGANTTGEGYSTFMASTKLSKKLNDIHHGATPCLELILSNVRSPVSKVIAISKAIKKSLREREFALLDMNTYSDHLTTLKTKDKGTLTLKQEQNIIRYEKNLVLSRLKYEQINGIFKSELPKFIDFLDQFMRSLQIILYFLQLTIHFQLLELNLATADSIKLRQAEMKMGAHDFSQRIIKTHYNAQQPVIDKLRSLNITKSALEQSLSNHMDSLSLSITETGNESVSVSLARSEVVFCTLKYDFNAQESGDLSFKEGDKIRILDKTTFNGDWCRGELDGTIGIFPKNYVTF